jgi:hypothetical protein
MGFNFARLFKGLIDHLQIEGETPRSLNSSVKQRFGRALDFFTSN